MKASGRGGGGRSHQNVMRRNQLYSIETSIRTAIPPKGYKREVDYDSEACWCFDGPDDDNLLEPLWPEETVKGKAVIHRC